MGESQTSTQTNVSSFEQGVYTFMHNEYKQLEKAGERFDEAKNDTLVEEKASKQFRISPEEAGLIYAKVESKIRQKSLFQ